MPPVRFILLAFVCISPVAHAGLRVTLVPSNPGPYDIADPASLNFNVDVMAQLDSNNPESVVFVLMRFDVADTDPALGLQGAPTHPQSKIGPISFWDLSATANCQRDPVECGNYYFVDSNFDDELVNLLLILQIEPLAGDRFRLSQTASTRLGVMELSLPAQPGVYQLDLLNADTDNPDRGARFTYGLGTPSSPRGNYVASDGTITGGRHVFTVVPEPATLAILVVGAGVMWGRKGHMQ